MIIIIIFLNGLYQNVEIKMQNHELTVALKERNKLLLDAEKAIQILHQQSGGISPSEEIDQQRGKNSELQHYKELLKKEREEKQNISNEANVLKRQLLDVKNQMQETNSELTELKKLQEATIKNFEGLQNGDEEIINNREMMKRIKDASDKARQEEAEKHGVLIQQLKGVSRQFLINIKNCIFLFEENCNSD
jgi:hypothetical protein